MLQLLIANKNYSSWSMRPWVLMRQAGIAFEEVMVPFDDFEPTSAFKQQVLARNPVGKVPVLVDGSLAGTPYWPSFDGAILFLEDVNEYVYRIDRMLSTLMLTGALKQVAGVALGGFTDCPPSEGSFGSLTLDEVFDEYFGHLDVPVYRGAQFGHIKRKFTLPLGVRAEIDADAGTLRLLEPAVQ